MIIISIYDITINIYFYILLHRTFFINFSQLILELMSQQNHV